MARKEGKVFLMFQQLISLDSLLGVPRLAFYLINLQKKKKKGLEFALKGVRPPVCWAMTGRGEAARDRRNCRAVGGIEKHCCPRKIKIGVNWAFSVIGSPAQLPYLL